MNQPLATRRLWWKELRQILPLFLMLLAIALVGHIVISFADDRSMREALLLGTPLLFATGIGALLIGQEKELKTLSWLRTLPIKSTDLLRVKLAASLLGLALTSACSYLLFVCFDWLDDPEAGLPGVHRAMISVGCQAVFMLLVGVYLAWRFRSSLLALGALVPIAIFPAWISSQPSTEDNWQRWYFGALAIGSATALIASWRAGSRCLRPARPTSPWEFAEEERHGAVRRVWGAPQGSTTALIWQFGRQTLALLAAGVALAVMSVLSSLWGNGMEAYQLSLFLALLGISWLGAAVFVGDRLQDRIRFLAERGVSPTKVWLTRHALPFCLMVFLAVATVFALRTASMLVKGYSAIGLGISLAMLWVVYVPSQWVGQLIRSPIVAAVTAPAVAGLCVGLGGLAFDVVGTPIWLLLLVSCLPMLATWWLMPRWMDGRLDVVYWSGHAITLVTCLLVPFLPVWMAALSPRMPREVAAEMESFLRQPGVTPAGSLLELSTGVGSRPVEADEPVEVNEVEANEVESRLQSIEYQLQTGRRPRQSGPANRPVDLSGPYRSNPQITQFLIAASNRSRWLAESDSSPPGVADHYRRSVGCLVALAERLVASHRLVEQDESAIIERWLRHEIGRKDASQLWDAELKETATALWRDPSSRSEARKRAIALSWQEWKHSADPNQPVPEPQAEADTNQMQLEVGGYWLGDQLPAGSLTRRITSRRRIERGFALLWELAGTEGAPSEHKLRELAELFGVPPESYGSGVTEPSARVRDLNRPAFPTGGLLAPGHAWVNDFAAVDLEDGIESDRKTDTEWESDDAE